MIEKSVTLSPIDYHDVPIIPLALILLNCQVKLNWDCSHSKIRARVHPLPQLFWQNQSPAQMTRSHHGEFLFDTISVQAIKIPPHPSYKRLTIDKIYFLLQTKWKWNKQKCFAKPQWGCELSYCNLILFMSHDSWNFLLVEPRHLFLSREGSHSLTQINTPKVFTSQTDTH